jgi:hypothetical protein
LIQCGAELLCDLIRKESATIYLTFGNNDDVDATLAGAKKGSTTVTFFVVIRRVWNLLMLLLF